MQVKSIRDAEVQGKRVLLRLDCDVPLENGHIVDDERLRAGLPTIAYLREHHATIIILAHAGRPGGKEVEALRLAPVAKKLAELLSLSFAPLEGGSYGIGDIRMLENLRFDPGEEANDPVFAQKLAALGDIFLNDAFADSHRAHASIVGIPKIIPGFAGLRLLEEITKLSEALTPPPGSLAIIGGAKFETKIPLLTKFAGTYDTVLVGGALAGDILKARGFAVGASLVSGAPVPRELASNTRIQAPTDVVVHTDAGDLRQTLVNDIRAGESIVDIGPQTAALWSERIKKAPFVLWNGPVGVYEVGRVEGTNALAQALVQSTCKAVIGGGDTAAALQKISFDGERIFLSTGGGAALDFLAEGTLVGIEALKR